MMGGGILASESLVWNTTKYVSRKEKQGKEKHLRSVQMN